MRADPSGPRAGPRTGLAQSASAGTRRPPFPNERTRLKLPLPRTIALAFGLAALLAVAGPAAAAPPAAAVTATQAWARATVAGQRAGGGYLTLNGGAAADKLVGASAPVAERVELHSMSMDGDVMRMRQVEAIDVPAGQAVELKPGGLHLMLMGLKQPLQAGSRFPLTLRFERGAPVTLDVAVEAAGAASAPAGLGQHAH